MAQLVFNKIEVTPRSAEHVAIHLNYLLFTKGKGVGSLIAAFYGIRWCHHMIDRDRGVYLSWLASLIFRAIPCQLFPGGATA